MLIQWELCVLLPVGTSLTSGKLFTKKCLKRGEMTGPGCHIHPSIMETGKYILALSDGVVTFQAKEADYYSKGFVQCE